MKFYHMIIGKEWEEEHGDKSTRREYTSKHQGSAPRGWKCIGVCGYYETTNNLNRYEQEDMEEE